MILDNRPLAYVRAHPFQSGAYLVYVPHEADSEELSTDDGEFEGCEEGPCYDALLAHDVVDIANLIAPRFRLATAEESERLGCPYAPVSDELLKEVQMQLDLWPLPPLIQDCFRASEGETGA